MALEIVDKLVEEAGNLRDKAMISLIGYSGARITEIMELRMEDIDIKNSMISIIHQKEKSKLHCPHCNASLGKRHLFCPECGKQVTKPLRQAIMKTKKRSIPINPKTMETLVTYVKHLRNDGYTGAFLFPSPLKEGKHLTRGRAWQIVQDLGRQIGEPNFHPHVLRHLFATSWVEKEGDLKYLQQHMGHANINTTMNYVLTNKKKQRSEYDKITGGE